MSVAFLLLHDFVHYLGYHGPHEKSANEQHCDTDDDRSERHCRYLYSTRLTVTWLTCLVCCRPQHRDSETLAYRECNRTFALSMIVTWLLIEEISDTHKEIDAQHMGN